VTIAFSPAFDRKTSPRTDAKHDFIVLECRNWVNVIAVTTDERLVMVEQYRHGSNTVELEIPAASWTRTTLTGSGRSSRTAEETGYEGEPAELIGPGICQPGDPHNTMYTVLVRNCHLRHELELDHGEDIETHLCHWGKFPH